MRSALRVSVPIAFLAIWQIVCELEVVRPLLLPSPVAVLRTLAEGLYRGPLLDDTLQTLRRLALGYAIGIGCGVPLGVIVGSSAMSRLVAELPTDFLRSLPVTSLLPLFLFILGVDDTGRIAVVAYAVGLLVFFNTANGVEAVGEHRRRVAKLLGASPMRQFFDIVLPEALPQIVVGLRLGISAAFVYAIVTEMFFGSVRGLGYRILESNLNYESERMYAAILLAGTIGYALNQLIVQLEKRFVHWKGQP